LFTTVAVKPLQLPVQNQQAVKQDSRQTDGRAMTYNSTDQKWRSNVIKD